MNDKPLYDGSEETDVTTRRLVAVARVGIIYGPIVAIIYASIQSGICG